MATLPTEEEKEATAVQEPAAEEAKEPTTPASAEDDVRLSTPESTPIEEGREPAAEPVDELKETAPAVHHEERMSEAGPQPVGETAEDRLVSAPRPKEHHEKVAEGKQATRAGRGNKMTYNHYVVSPSEKGYVLERAVSPSKQP